MKPRYDNDTLAQFCLHKIWLKSFIDHVLIIILSTYMVCKLQNKNFLWLKADQMPTLYFSSNLFTRTENVPYF